MNMSSMVPQVTSFGDEFVREDDFSNEIIDWTFSWSGSTDNLMILEGRLHTTSGAGDILWGQIGGFAGVGYWGSEITNHGFVGYCFWGAGQWIREPGGAGAMYVARITRNGGAFYSAFYMGGGGGYKGAMTLSFGQWDAAAGSWQNVRGVQTHCARTSAGNQNSVRLFSKVNMTGNIKVFKRAM